MWLSVVMPARDEMAVIGSTLAAYRRTLPRRSELIVADDWSTDRTALIAAQYGAKVTRATKRGYGHAVREGLQAACGEHVIIVCADGADAPEAFRRFWEARYLADGVFGDRWSRGRPPTYPRLKYHANRFGNAQIAKRLGYGYYRDWTNPFKLYRRDDLRLDPVVPDMSYGLALALRWVQDGNTFTIVPHSWTERTHGTSKFRLGLCWRYWSTFTTTITTP